MLEALLGTINVLRNHDLDTAFMFHKLGQNNFPQIPPVALKV